MAVAVWDDSFRTGHKVVDTQHQELFQMVNELHDAIIAGKGKEHMGPTLEHLANYTVQHFRSEEELMKQVSYPAQAQHKAKHVSLTNEVVDLIKKYKEGNLVLSTTLSTFLANWLRHHIKEDDIALIKYVKTHPAVAAS